MNKRRNVRSAFLFQAVIIPGTSVAGDTTLNMEKQGKTINLSFDELGLHIEQNGTEALVPANNVRSIVWAKVDEKAK